MRVLAALWKYITRATPDDPEVDPWWYLPPAPLDTDPETRDDQDP